MGDGPTKDFWQMAGLALMFLAITLGMGSCGALINVSECSTHDR